MTVPALLPDWVPWWVQLVILVGVVLVAGAFVLMPFSVFGLKARLEAIDDRLDELQSDLRALTHRLPDPEMRNPAAWRRGVPDEDGYVAPSPALRRDRAPTPPPVAAPAPAPLPATERPIDRTRDERRDWDDEREPGRDWERGRVAPPAAPPPRRSEPQLNWPENRPRR